MSNASDWEGFAYDAAGNLIQQRLRDARVLVFDYDYLNRLRMKRTWQINVGITQEIDYTYDLGGLQTSATFGVGGQGVFNAHNAFGQLVSSTTTMGRTTRMLSYSYDANGNRVMVKHPDGVYFGTFHDGLNRPYYSYSPNGGIRYAVYLPWGPIGATYTPVTSTVLGYDGIQRLDSEAHSIQGGNVHWTYGYNPNSQLVSVDRDNDAYAWTRHHAMSLGYQANGLNQYGVVTSVGYAPTTLSYDANGNLISDGTDSYVYDVENRLVGASGLHNATLAYDPLGRLWQVSAPVAGGGTTTTQFLYDGDALVAEYDGAGAMTHRYAHWEGADVPMIAYDHDDLLTPHYLFADHQGSIVALADGAGALSAINTYDEYGIPAATNQGRFQYTGQAWLPELGLYYYKARTYSPTLGRFMQTDPIRHSDGMNMYDYVHDDPVNNSDPTGLLCHWRYADGTCKVRLPRNATDAEREAGRLVEGRLNHWDPLVQKLPNDARIPVLNENGQQTGTITGLEYRRLWNDIGTSIVPNGTVANGAPADRPAISVE